MVNLDWGKLPFGYVKTNYNVRSYFRNGAWTKLEATDSEIIPIHMAATALHYGQTAFEGLKAYKGKDGKVRLFRWNENAHRMQSSADGVMMAAPSDELFKEACFEVIKKNIDFVPPYGTGASLYLRPLLIGTGARVGVKPADEYLFMIFVTPVGPYFKEGFKPTNMMLAPDYDRAAPLGTGRYKVGGNYAASLKPGEIAHAKGYSAALFLDAKEKKYIDEAGPANFFGIRNNTYITPDSTSILPSITNMSLMTIAQDLGIKVERRHVPLEELSTFEEAGFCGTAAVISPIGKIVDEVNKHEWVFSKDGNAGPISTKLYQALIDIQYGNAPDTHNWVTIVE